MLRDEPLTRYTGYLLRRAFVKSSGCLRECMAEDAHLREVVALSILAERGPLSQQTLGALGHINRSLVVKLVDGLEAKSWVVRERSRRDRRSYALRITDAGLGTLGRLRRDLDRSDQALTGPLTADEARRLTSWLGLLLADQPAVAITSLSQRAGFLVAEAHRCVRQRAEALLEPMGLHPRDFAMLSVVADEQPCSQSRVAAALGITAPGVLPALTALEAAGLVSRTRRPGDRRVYDLTLTDDGRRLVTRARRAAARVQAEIRDRLGDDGDRDLRQLLDKLLA